MEKNNYIPPQLLKTAEGYNIFYKNRYLYPEHNPLKRIETKIYSLEITENTLIIIPSPLLFLGIEKIIRKLKKNCSILFIEKDRDLYNLTDNIYKRFSSVLLETEISVQTYCSSFDFSPYRKIILLPLNNGYFINRNFYNKSLDIFRKNLNTFWKNKITMISLSSRWYCNILKNIPLFLNGDSADSISIEGPVVVAGAGESVEKSIPLLKKHRNSFTLIAIDTALSTLFYAGIKPDFILAVESQFYNIYDFYNYRDSKIPLICDISSYPQTGRITRGKNYFFFSEFTKSYFSGRLGKNNFLPLKIPPLGSVGVIAVYLASIITDSPVIYTGLDFSFIPGKSHSKSSPFITLTSLLKGRTDTMRNYSFCLRGDYIKTRDVNGMDVFTNSGLRSYSESLKEIILNKNNIYSLFPSGIAYNEHYAASEKDFVRLLNTKPYIKYDNPSKTPAVELKSFYQEEHDNLLNIIRISVDFLNSRSTDIDIELLKQMLIYSDYITEDFPEKAMPERITPPYLKRVLLSAYKYERIIKNALSSLD